LLQRPPGATIDLVGVIARHGGEVDSVFDLLGRNENDVTAAFGFTLANSPLMLSTILARVLPGADVESEPRFALRSRFATHLVGPT
jgi:hypothetical protein